jgi:hypothetical protein
MDRGEEKGNPRTGTLREAPLLGVALDSILRSAIEKTPQTDWALTDGSRGNSVG